MIAHAQSRERYTTRVLDESDPRWRCIICERAVYVQKHTCATATVKEPLNPDPQENDKDLGLRAIEELHSRNEEQTSVISVMNMNMSFEILGL